jgi:hypothetical protein
MASERKKRAKQMARLGWVWEPSWNSWVFFDLWSNPAAYIQYRAGQKDWQLGEVLHPDGVPEWGEAFGSPLAAAVFAEVQLADRLAAVRKEIEGCNRERIGL